MLNVMDADKSLRHWVAWLLDGEGAHATFDQAINGFPAKLRGTKPEGLPHTGWQLLEHMRIAQWDILDFSVNPNYKAMAWPKDYWPKSESPRAGEWDKSVRRFRDELSAIRKLVTNPKTDLHSPLPWGDGQTILREVLLLADHNSYHLGQLVLVRKALDAWKG